jgi:nitroreductase
MKSAELAELIKTRRSIRKYEDRQISTEDLQKIIDAGLFAPNAGGGQRAVIRAVHNKELAEKIGRMNVSNFDRSNLAGSYVSKEQPSTIDDPTIKSGFYDAPTVCAIFAPRRFLYSIPDAYCCASNMVLMAKSLGISSCIVARGEETFDSEEGRKILKDWDISENYFAVCFVILGYCKGEYPKIKDRKENRYQIIE